MVTLSFLACLAAIVVVVLTIEADGSLRLRSERRKPVQNVSSSLSPMSTPRISRSPQAVIPVAMTTVRDTTWPRASSRTWT